MKFETYLAEQKTTGSDTLDLTRYLSRNNLKILEAWLSSHGDVIKKIIIANFRLQDEYNAHEIALGASEHLGHARGIIAAEMLASNQIDPAKTQSRDETLKKLAKMLSSLANLQELHLKENEWGAAGTGLFLTSLELTGLKVFVIDSQWVQLEGLKVFLQRHQYISQLSLGNIHLHESEFRQLLEEITERLPYLNALHLSHQSDEPQPLVLEKLILLGERKNHLVSLTYNNQTPDWFPEQVKQHKAQMRQALLAPERRRDQLLEALRNNNLTWFKILLFANQTPEVIEGRDRNFQMQAWINKHQIGLEEKLLNEMKSLLELHSNQSVSTLKIEFDQSIQQVKQETTQRILHSIQSILLIEDTQPLVAGVEEYVRSIENSRLVDELLNIEQLTESKRQELIQGIEERKSELAEDDRTLTAQFEYFEKELAKLKKIAETVRKNLVDEWPLNVPEDYAQHGDDMKDDLCRSSSCLQEEEQSRETGEITAYSTLDALLIEAYRCKQKDGLQLLLESGANPYAQKSGDTSVFVRVLNDAQELGELQAQELEQILMDFTQGPISDRWPHSIQAWVPHEHQKTEEIKNQLDEYIQLLRQRNTSPVVLRVLSRAEFFLSERKLEISHYLDDLRRISTHESKEKTLAICSRMLNRAMQARRGILKTSALNDPMVMLTKQFQSHLKEHGGGYQKQVERGRHERKLCVDYTVNYNRPDRMPAMEMVDRWAEEGRAVLREQRNQAAFGELGVIEARIVAIEAETDSVQQSYNQIQNQLVTINTRLAVIKNSLDYEQNQIVRNELEALRQSLSTEKQQFEIDQTARVTVISELRHQMNGFREQRRGIIAANNLNDQNFPVLPGRAINGEPNPARFFPRAGAQPAPGAAPVDGPRPSNPNEPNQ